VLQRNQTIGVIFSLSSGSNPFPSYVSRETAKKKNLEGGTSEFILKGSFLFLFLIYLLVFEPLIRGFLLLAQYFQDAGQD
jgi:hypothetical protein